MQGTWTKDVAAVSSAWGIFVFARGTDDNVYYRRLSGGAWSGWTSLAGQTSAAPAAAADASGVHLVVRAQDGMWTRRWNGTNFENWVFLGANASGTPAVAASASGVYVFVRAQSDAGTWVNRYTAGAWSGFTSLNWATNASPVAAGEVGGAAVHVFVRGNDGNLYWGRMVPAGFTGFALVGWPGRGRRRVGVTRSGRRLGAASRGRPSCCSCAVAVTLCSPSRRPAASGQCHG